MTVDPKIHRGKTGIVISHLNDWVASLLAALSFRRTATRGFSKVRWWRVRLLCCPPPIDHPP